MSAVHNHHNTAEVHSASEYRVMVKKHKIIPVAVRLIKLYSINISCFIALLSYALLYFYLNIAYSILYCI